MSIDVAAREKKIQKTRRPRERRERRPEENKDDQGGAKYHVGFIKAQHGRKGKRENLRMVQNDGRKGNLSSDLHDCFPFSLFL